MEKIALVTGATSGIGRATALKLAEAGYSVIITGRRWHLLAELEKQLIKISKVLALSFDVSNNEDVNHAIDKLPEEWKNIEILVNNLQFHNQLQVNLDCQVYLIHYAIIFSIRDK